MSLTLANLTCPIQSPVDFEQLLLVKKEIAFPWFIKYVIYWLNIVYLGNQGIDNVTNVQFEQRKKKNQNPKKPYYI